MASELAVWAEAVPAEEGRKSSSRPVDLVHLSRYTLGERELEREVLELFCSQSLIYIERLREARSDKDWKDAAHTLKGSASAIGAWRAKEGQFAIDATGTLPDGRSFDGPQGLKSILKAQPDAFAECLTRKLLIYALGRGLEPDDDPAVKQIVKNVAADNYRFSSLILGIVKSEPFQKRRRENPQ